MYILISFKNYNQIGITILGDFMKNKLIFIILFSIIGVFSMFSEDINFFARSNFSVMQFWEKDASNDSDAGGVRNYSSTYLSGSFGVGMEMIIWDMGKKRGSRIFFKTCLDMLFSGPVYVNYYTSSEQDMTKIHTDYNGGASYIGTGIDFILGGTFPKTDLIWGIGSGFNFIFPLYSSYKSTLNFNQKFVFYATPSIMIGYDFFVPNTKFKITPQLRTGITCVPFYNDYYSSSGDQSFIMSMASRDTINDDFFNKVSNKYSQTNSGIYIDLSVAFSFYSVQWRK